jgi:hypothetical protein
MIKTPQSFGQLPLKRGAAECAKHSLPARSSSPPFEGGVPVGRGGCV